jgi:predicted GNAT family N-acyltransferase
MEKNNLHVVWDLNSYVENICELFSETHWAAWRRKEDVKAMLRNSIVSIGLVDGTTDTLVGFARVVGDGKFKAIIEDVVVSEELRGKGIGTILVDALLNHPLVAGVEEVELYCSKDLLTFYGKAGFNVVSDQLFMRTKGRTFSSSTQ